MKCINVFLCVFFLIAAPCVAQTVSEGGLVRVYIPTSDEEQSVLLKPHQKAIVFVYLSSLGDPLDKYMVSIVSNHDNKLVANAMSGSDGEVVFRRIGPGEYTVFVNRRVVRDEEMSSVRVADVRIRTRP